MERVDAPIVEDMSLKSRQSVEEKVDGCNHSSEAGSGGAIEVPLLGMNIVLTSMEVQAGHLRIQCVMTTSTVVTPLSIRDYVVFFASFEILSRTSLSANAYDFSTFVAHFPSGDCSLS